jgi:hypothetical protein
MVEFLVDHLQFDFENYDAVIPLVLELLCNLIDEESVAVMSYCAFLHFFAIIQEHRFANSSMPQNEIALMCEEAHTWAIASGDITAASKSGEILKTYISYHKSVKC